MARDYGNKRSSRQRGGAPHQFLVIIVTFLLGYLTASFFDVQTVSNWMNTQVLAHHDVKQEPVKAEAQHAKLPPKPKFEFYTLLANEKGATQPNAGTNTAAAAHQAQTASTATTPATGREAVVTAANNSLKSNALLNSRQNPVVKVAEGKPLKNTAPANKGGYLVQVASFKARQDAEHMKGLLILKGFDVNVVPISQAHGNWFRVVVGPYANRVQAQKAQSTLAKTERLRGMVRSAGG